MAEYLALTDGITLIEFNAGGWGVVEYAPRAPDLTVEEVESLTIEGSEVSEVSRRNVTEPVRARYRSTAATAALRSADLQAKVQAVQQLLRRSEEPSWSVWVLYDAGGVAANAYRSEVLVGSADAPPESFEWGGWESGVLDLSIIWTRRYFWESQTEVAMTISNTSGSGSAGITVKNHNDAGAGDDDYIDLLAVNVLGTVPAPIRLEMTNNGPNDASRHGTIWAGHNVFGGDVNHTATMEGESGTGGSQQPGVADNSLYSGGFYRSVSWAGDAWVTAQTFTLSTLFLNKTRGRWFTPLFHFSGPGDPLISFQLRVMMELTLLWESQVFRFPANTSMDLHEGPPVPLPPAVPAIGDLYPLSLVLLAQKTGGGSYSLDALRWFPLDGYRRYEPLGYNLAYGARLVDDNLNNELYTDLWATAGKLVNYDVFGPPLYAWPNRNQRIHFAIRSATGGAGINRSISVQVWYRPRRLTV